MKIALNYITQYLLSSFEVECLTCDNPMLEINNCYILNDFGRIEPDSIIICKASDLPENLPDSDNSKTFIFICTKDSVPNSDYYKKDNVILICCPENTSLTQLLSSINVFFYNTVSNFDLLQRLMNEIAETTTFSCLLKTVSEIMLCPAALLSQGFKLLGYYENVSEELPYGWEATIRNKFYPSSEVVARIPPRGLSAYDSANHRVITDTTAFPESGEAFFPILSEDRNHEVLGFLYFPYQNKNLILSKGPIINFISYAMSFRMWRYINMPSKEDSSLGFLLRDIISGSVLSDDEIQQRLENIHYKTLPYNYLIVIYTSGKDHVSKNSWAQLRTAFSLLWPDDIMMNYNGDLLLLISSESENIPASSLSNFTAVLEKNGCYGGISDCFSEIDKSLRNHYTRTIAAAKTAQALSLEKRYANYANTALIHLLRSSISFENLRDLCDPRILKLASYDTEHSSNYFYTLQCYWHFGQDIQKVCNYLYIHRNTLFYRLKKIREISGLDFTSADHMIQFSLSFAILTALGEVEYAEFPECGEEHLGE